MSLFARRSSSAADAAGSGFAARLRRETRAVHTRAEKTTFIRGFLRGAATIESYARLLAGLHPVYIAMERETLRLATAEPASPLARFCFPELFRAEALERDLIALLGPSWRHAVTPMPAAEAYVRRIELVAVAEPTRLIGHLYTRYLGDLSGGQVLARIAARSLGLAPGAGLDFYAFPAVPDIAAMKARFRAGLDTLDEDGPACTAGVVDEAVRAFRHNIAIFEQLRGNAFLCALRNLPLPGLRARRRSVVWPVEAAAAN